MGLRIELKPYERLIINGAAIRNGDRRSDFLVENHCKFLRESEIIYEGEVDSPCKQLWLTLQVIHLSDESQQTENLFFAQASELLGVMPSAAPYLAEIERALSEKQTYKAIKAIKKLIAHERDAANVVAARQGAPSAMIGQVGAA